MCDVDAVLMVRLDAAKSAAPYIHPRLAAIEHKGEGGGPIEIAWPLPKTLLLGKPRTASRTGSLIIINGQINYPWRCYDMKSMIRHLLFGEAQDVPGVDRARYVILSL